MELSTETFRKLEKLPYPSLDEAKVMAIACSKLVAGVITDDNCGKSDYSNALMKGRQNFLFFDPGSKPGRRAVQRNSDCSGSGAVVQEAARPTVAAKRKSAVSKAKSSPASTDSQDSVSIIDVDDTAPATKRPRALVTRAEETCPAGQRAQPQHSQYETEVAVLKAKSEASKALHDAQVELARQTECVKAFGKEVGRHGKVLGRHGYFMGSRWEGGGKAWEGAGNAWLLHGKQLGRR
jgi:hypothetical protein